MAGSRFRIRVLGDLEVTRGDGTLVAPDAWRTGKSMDLLRMLALAGGRPVRVHLLTGKLWPDVPDERARGSLRTAASHVRRAVGFNCIGRSHDGMLLVGAWVDAVEFLLCRRKVHLARDSGDLRFAVRLVRSAEALHRGEFRAYDDESAWAQAERDALVQARLEMLCAGAESNLELSEHREALDLATTATRLDPSSESAHRLLMRAHAELGEVGSALRVFERYRAHLAHDLGADPSAQTRELHLRILRGSDL